MSRPPTDPTSGVLLVDKPAGMTSHDVVARTRRLAGTRKVGHAGTLDPMATGLLLLGLNSSTRLLTYLVGLDKEYLATIRLGASTTTDDRDGEQTGQADAALVAAISDEDIARVLAKLTGDIDQVPSTVSAIKVDGQRAYARARAGETVELASRHVRVSEFEVLSRRDEAGFADLDVRVRCSSGTYIRALARDAGWMLRVGGHLTALRRTRVGPFHVDDAAHLDTLVVADARRDPAEIAATLFDSITLDGAQVTDLTHGKRLTLESAADDAPVAALAPDGRLVGLLEVSGGRARPLVNFPTDEVVAGGDRS